jgi:hypothetical protein
MNGRSEIVALDFDHVLEISNGRCMPLTFDVNSLSWYGGGQEDFAALAAGASPTPRVKAPVRVAGSQALTMAPPANQGGCGLP